MGQCVPAITIFVLESFEEDKYPAEKFKTLEVFIEEWLAKKKDKADPFHSYLAFFDPLSICHTLAELGLLEYQFTHAWCRTKRGTEELKRLKKEAL